MPTELRRSAVPKFPLRLMPSVRQAAETFSEREGVSLNQFINVAVAERLARLQHEEWIRGRGKVTPERIARVLELLDKAGSGPAEPGDELPAGYVPFRDRPAK